MRTTELLVKNLKVSFSTPKKELVAVRGISYQLYQGEILALVGESGCGKTVSALSILRLIQEPPGKINSGEIIFGGKDLLTLKKKELQDLRGKDIAMIFQDPMTSLNPVLTIGEQIVETILRHTVLSRKEAKEKSFRLLELVEISSPQEKLSQYPHQLSGGMRQRVMIAIALSCDPKLIIADEPTTALDVTIQAQILELMQGLAKELGTALIIITHNLGVVARYADRVIVMYAGKIIEESTAEEIFHNPMHAYTRGLLASVPRLDATEHVKLQTIEGLPPDLVAPPPGCGFQPRCQKNPCKCSETPPEIVEAKKGHFIVDCKCCRK